MKIVGVTFLLLCFSTGAFVPPGLPASPVGYWVTKLVACKAKTAKKKKRPKKAPAVAIAFGSARSQKKSKSHVRPQTSQRGQGDGRDPETERLISVYTKYFKEQEQHREPPLGALDTRRRLVQISASPLMFTIDNFIDPDKCRRVDNNGAGCFDLDFPGLVSDLLFNGQESEMDGLLFNYASSRDHSSISRENGRDHFPDGLHMDTNGACLFRHVTAILYLNDVPVGCGGATIFPLARALPHDPALAASRRLLAEKISHTRSRSCEVAGLVAEAQLLEKRVGRNFLKDPQTETAVTVQPKAGRLLLFFSRCAINEKTTAGAEDPRAWHAGERLYDRDSSPTEKRILTLFKQVDYSSDYEPSLSETTFENFLAPQIREQQQRLQARL